MNLPCTHGPLIATNREVPDPCTPSGGGVDRVILTRAATAAESAFGHAATRIPLTASQSLTLGKWKARLGSRA